MIDIHSAFSQHLLQLTVTDAVFAVPAYGPQNDVTLKMPAFEWVHVQLHQQKGMISLSPPTICNSAVWLNAIKKECVQAKAEIYSAFFSLTISR
ncbi:hypothetical protein [Escherichia coli]|uniref:hypothetical protein n=11 Tax=Enterobacteriaceae TaxID=543 RepID=UPI000AB4EC35